jgi:hypothetical protein
MRGQLFQHVPPLFTPRGGHTHHIFKRLEGRTEGLHLGSRVENAHPYLGVNFNPPPSR